MAAAAASPGRLRRLMRPDSIAVVGLSDGSRLTRSVEPTLDGSASVFFVNPKHATVLGRPAAPSLSALQHPVDAVVSFMSAERTTELVEEAAQLDVGGMVLIAGMFAEAGPQGAVLQERIRSAAAARRMPLVGPNSLGYINVRRHLYLTMSMREERRPGGISVVSQSGAMLSAISMAGWHYDGCGFNALVSSGNEAVTDLADYVDYLAGDPDTVSIGLVIEAIRRPSAFFSAVARAAAAGKPVVAIKLGRHERSRQVALSHTASVAGNAWVYDVALSQAGVTLAHDPEELVDRLALFEQIPRGRWSAVRNLGIVTRTGGFASLSFDVAEAEGVNVPPLDSLGPWVREKIPGVTVANPLDATTFGIPIWPEVLEKYTRSDELDALMAIHPLSHDSEVGRAAVTEFAAAAASAAKPCVICNYADVPGSWAKPFLDGHAAMGRGLRGTLRGLQTMGAFVRHLAEDRAEVPAPEPLGRPAVAAIDAPEGNLVPFGTTMALLAAAGLPTAPYLIVPAGCDATRVRPGFPSPWVVKLADVGHRTEYDAVRLGVAANGLPDAVAALRAIARGSGLPQTVVVQPQIENAGEVFIGIQGQSDLGPLVAFGVGGIFVEALHRVHGRMAPFSPATARALIDELADLGVMHGARGRQPWDLDALSGTLAACSRLAAAATHWIDSLDLNPVIWSGGGFVVVDATLLTRTT
jgi:acyl-CoA synthetase (NDP forming)